MLFDNIFDVHSNDFFDYMSVRLPLVYVTRQILFIENFTAIVGKCKILPLEDSHKLTSNVKESFLNGHKRQWCFWCLLYHLRCRMTFYLGLIWFTRDFSRCFYYSKLYFYVFEGGVVALTEEFEWNEISTIHWIAPLVLHKVAYIRTSIFTVNNIQCCIFDQFLTISAQFWMWER